MFSVAGRVAPPAGNAAGKKASRLPAGAEQIFLVQGLFKRGKSAVLCCAVLCCAVLCCFAV
jgi:hypothetical protein